MADNEATLKLKADISDLKKQFQQAQRTVRSANAEFQAATVGMDNWAASADGLQAKVNQLTSVLGAEETKLNSLQEQYDKTVQLMGKNSVGAQELEIKLNKQKVAVANVSAELQKWQNSLDNVGKESTDIVSVMQKQEAELESLKDEYTKVVFEQGKNSAAAKELKEEITQLSGALSKNKEGYELARKEADKLDKSLDDSGDAAEKAKEGFTVMKGALADLIADGIRATVDALLDMTKELMNAEGAYKNFQAQTGKTTEEMSEFKEQINELYKDDLGESLNDVADAMAKVAQNTKETDPTKIKELTENALVLRDTFGYDVQESMRAVNMLMDQFGITGDEAFNLIVQGAQNGLDKNGDMLDSINEYSVHYKQMGYDADDFFNSLANGTEEGTFSVDKLGDAMKEFGIRTKDTAESTNEGFELLGLNAEIMRKEFAKGGESAQKATKKTIKALFEMEDEVKQNQAGVALFGTMWEDLGKEGVEALMNTEGALTTTKKSMEEIKQLRYDDVMTQLSALGRQIQVDVLLPVIEQALPKVKEGITWISQNINTLVPIVGTLGAAMATAFVINKIAVFAQSIQGLIGLVRTMTTVTKAQTVATKAEAVAQTTLNATNPFGWVALAVTALATLIPLVINLANGSNDLSAEYAKLNSEEKKLRDETNKLTTAYNDWNESKNKTIANTNAEFAYYDELRNELSDIVDENGKIKKGYEDRATVITGILSEALGVEIQITDGVIQKYGELRQSIAQVIEAKKAEAILNGLEQDYITAIQNKTVALQNYTANQQALKDMTEELNVAKADYQKLQEDGYTKWAKENGLMLSAESTMQLWKKTNDEARAKVEGLNSKISDQSKATRESEETYLGYISTIENYEGVTAAIVSGDTEKITTSLTKLEKGFITAENGTKAALEAQTYNYKVELDNLKKAIKNKTPGVTQEQVDQMEKLVELSEAELKKFAPKAEKQGEKGGEGFGEGIENEKETVKKDAEKVAEKAEEGLKEADAESTGEDLIEGFSEGMENKEQSLWDKAWGLGKSAIKAIKKAIDSNSPSKEAMKIGGFFTDGLGIGIEDGADELADKVGKLGYRLLGTMDNELVYDKLIDSVEEAYDDRLERIEKSFDDEIKAFEKKQEQERKVLDESINKELRAHEQTHERKLKMIEKEHKEKLANIDEEYTEQLKLVDEEEYKRIKAIEDEIAGINAETEAEEKAIKEKEQQERIAELEKQIREAKTAEERKAAEEELAEYKADIAREQLLEERQLRIDTLNAEKEQIKENAEEEREQLKATLEAEQAALDEEYDKKVAFENAGYDATMETLEKQWEARRENLETEQEAALSNLQARHDKYLENVKKQLDAELESLKLQEEATLAMLERIRLTKMYDTGTSIVEGLKKGLADGVGAVFGAGWNIGIAALDGLKEATDTHSPSRAAMAIGEYFAQGLGLGIEDGEDGILRSIKDLASDITDTLREELDFNADLLSPLSADVGELTGRSFKSNAVAGATKNISNVTNFYQTNNSPKPLSRTEIYRQTKNQLLLAGGGK